MAENATDGITHNDGLDELSTRSEGGGTNGGNQEPTRVAETPAILKVSPFEFDFIESSEPRTRSAEPERTEPGTDFDDFNPEYRPVQTAGPGSGTEPRRGRGRPPGSRNKETTNAIPRSLTEGLETLLLSVHTMGAAILNAPEWELTKDEAKQLANAAHEVGKHYDMSIDPKKMAIINLAAVAGGIYAPRLLGSLRLATSAPKGPVLVKSEPKRETAVPKQPTAPPAKNGLDLTPFETSLIADPPRDGAEGA